MSLSSPLHHHRWNFPTSVLLVVHRRRRCTRNAETLTSRREMIYYRTQCHVKRTHAAVRTVFRLSYRGTTAVIITITCIPHIVHGPPAGDWPTTVAKHSVAGRRPRRSGLGAVLSPPNTAKRYKPDAFRRATTAIG